MKKIPYYRWFFPLVLAVSAPAIDPDPPSWLAPAPTRGSLLAAGQAQPANASPEPARTEHREPGASPAELSFAAGQSLLEKGKPRPAVGYFTRAIQLDPSSKEYRRRRGLAFLLAGDFQKAIEDLQAASEELGPYRETKFPGLGGYLDWQRAREQYLEANDELAKGNLELAVNMYRTALTIYPYYPQCWHNLAIALGKQGRYAEAERACAEAISFRYRDWKFWKTLGYELYMQNKLHGALAAMEQVMTLEPPVPDYAEMIENIEIVKDRLR